MKFKLPADHNDFPGDSPERRDAALAAAGALCQPQDVIEDHGDFNGDWSRPEHNVANGVSCLNSSQPGVKSASMADIDVYYASRRSAAIKIRRLPNESND